MLWRDGCPSSVPFLEGRPGYLGLVQCQCVSVSVCQCELKKGTNQTINLRFVMWRGCISVTLPPLSTVHCPFSLCSCQTVICLLCPRHTLRNIPNRRGARGDVIYCLVRECALTGQRVGRGPLGRTNQCKPAKKTNKRLSTWRRARQEREGGKCSGCMAIRTTQPLLLQLSRTRAQEAHASTRLPSGFLLVP